MYEVTVDFDRAKSPDTAATKLTTQRTGLMCALYWEDSQCCTFHAVSGDGTSKPVAEGGGLAVLDKAQWNRMDRLGWYRYGC